ncbi:hypothetical protein [Bosea sp. FBZP-16]|uniref:hypothetical protein n=1 Tax=Bosea sp. FBZP-16 TaxID=2065382 RepID=UPI000C30AF79|nr:hypothetical protein [Bosea sp. FBZP-16]
MATIPKLAPCPGCGETDGLDVYKYESGWRYVECDLCWYHGPGEGSIREAVKSHNDRVADLAVRRAALAAEYGPFVRHTQPRVRRAS